MSEYEKWLATRPQAVRDFAERMGFEPGDAFEMPDGEWLYFIGFAENTSGEIGVWVSPHDPFYDYDGAKADKRLLCTDHFDVRFTKRFKRQQGD